MLAVLCHPAPVSEFHTANSLVQSTCTFHLLASRGCYAVQYEHRCRRTLFCTKQKAAAVHEPARSCSNEESMQHGPGTALSASTHLCPSMQDNRLRVWDSTLSACSGDGASREIVHSHDFKWVVLLLCDRACSSGCCFCCDTACSSGCCFCCVTQLVQVGGAFAV